MSDNNNQNQNNNNNNSTVTSSPFVSVCLRDSTDPTLLSTWTIAIRHKTEGYDTVEDIVVKSTLNSFSLRYLNSRHPAAKKAGYHILTREDDKPVFTHIEDVASLADPGTQYSMRAYFSALALAILLDTKNVTPNDTEILTNLAAAFGTVLEGQVTHTPVRFNRSVNVKGNIWSAFLPYFLNPESTALGLDIDVDYIKLAFLSLLFNREDFKDCRIFDAYVSALYSDIKDSSAYKLCYRITQFRVFINAVHEKLWPQVISMNMLTSDDVAPLFPQFDFTRTWRAMPLKNIMWSQPTVSTTFNVDLGV